MAFDFRSHNHHPGSPLSGSRMVSSSGSHSFLQKLTSFTKRSRSHHLAASPSHTTAHPSLPTPPSSPPSSSSSAPSRMALAAAQTASLKATANTGLLTPPSTARPASSTRPASRPRTSVSATSSSVRMDAASGTCSAPLVVHVEIRFPGLDGFRATPSYVNEYASSPDLEVSSRLCKGLLRRLTHCSTELITRRDSKALMQQQQRNGHAASAKPLAYELRFRIIRKDAGVWADKTFCSYQKQHMSSHDAHEVILATHRMVGFFMRRHDPAFRWSNAPAAAQLAPFVPRPEAPELVPHVLGRPLSLSCIPRSRFLDDSQSFEFVPGYAIKLSFRSRCHTRKQYEWRRAISVQSHQSAPLNLAHAEDLLWQTFESVNSALSVRRQAFTDEHSACDLLEGVASCQHFDEDALDIELSIQNNLGPNFTHLTRSIHSKLALFRHPDGADCHGFIHNVHCHLVQSRDTADARATSLPDLDYRITAVKTSTWSLDNPARFILDASTSYSRRSIEAILDRVETGIYDVLRNKGCTVHVVAYKRGHLVLDRSLVTSSLPSKPALFPRAPAEEDADEIISNLKERVHRDINAVCKDTCSLDSLDNSDDLWHSSSPPMTPTAEKFDNTVFIREPSMADDEPVIPAPRVVELPEDFYHSDSRRSSSAASSRQRAFPLVPEKFTLAPFRGSSSGASTPPTGEEALPEVHTVAAGAMTTPEPSIAELAEMPAESPPEMLLDVPAQLSSDAPADDLAKPVDPVEILADAPENTVIEHSIERLVEPLAEVPAAPALAEITTVEETQAEDDSEMGLVDETATPQSTQNHVMSMALTAEDDSSECSYESFHDECQTEGRHSSQSDNALASTEPIEDYLAQTPPSANIDIRLEPQEPQEPLQEQAQGAALDPAPSFYSFDDGEEPTSVELRFEREGSPAVGTQLDTILESDDEISSEFDFDFPAYEQGLPYVPSAHSVQANNAATEMSENDSLDKFGQTAGSDNESEHVPEPMAEQPEEIENIADVAEDADSSESEDEPLSFSTPARKLRGDSLTGFASTPRPGSSDLTRPSTPSLSHSSGGFNSPDTAFLETPRMSQGSYPTMATSFDAEIDSHNGHSHDADRDYEPAQFSQFTKDPKPTAVEPVGHIAVHQGLPLDEIPVALASSASCDISESDSTPTEVECVANAVTTDSEVANQYPNPQPQFEASTPSPALDKSFKDFAMTKPNLDLDEDAEVANDDLASEEHFDTALAEDAAAEADANELQLQDYGPSGLSQQDSELESPPPSPVQIEGNYELTHKQLLESPFSRSRHHRHIKISRLMPPSRADLIAEEEEELTPFEYDFLHPLTETDPVIETDSVAEAELLQRFCLEHANSETHIPSSQELFGDSFHEAVDELTLSEGGAPSGAASGTHDEFVEPEVQTQRWLELTDPEIEVSPDHLAHEHSEGPDQLGTQAPDEDVEILLPSAEDEASSREGLVKDEDVSFQQAIHAVSTKLPSLDSPTTCQSTVLPTPPDSDNELEMEDHADVHREASPSEFDTEERGPEAFTQEAVPVLVDEEEALVSCIRSPDNTVDDQLVAADESSLSESASPIVETELDSDLQKAELPSLAQTPSAESPMLAPNTATPTPAAVADEDPQLGDSEPALQVSAAASFSPSPLSASWFLPRAGLVGLDESRLARVGLRGALTGSRAFDSVSSHASSLPVQGEQLAVDEDIDVDEDLDVLSADDAVEEAKPGPEPSISESAEEATPAAVPTTPMKAKEKPATDQDALLPRVVMAFASVVVISQMINRSSSS